MIWMLTLQQKMISVVILITHEVQQFHNESTLLSISDGAFYFYSLQIINQNDIASSHTVIMMEEIP